MLREYLLAQVGTIFQPLATYEMPPTYFPTSKVTSCFQTIVDAYGIARYREANPAVSITIFSLGCKSSSIRVLHLLPFRAVSPITCTSIGLLKSVQSFSLV